jgi:4-amino-4-deoxy-L-arabinose transferase-like glycosyltransferase
MYPIIFAENRKLKTENRAFPPAAMAPAHPRRFEWLPGLALILLGLALYLPALWAWPLSRSEAMYALIPRQMLASGDWLTPILNGVPYLDKPPLIYWLNLAAYGLLGESAWAVRVATLALGLGEVWLTYVIGRRLLGVRPAWLGGFVLLTGVGFFTLHLQILTDHLVTLGLLAALAVLVYADDRPSWREAVLFQIALAVGFLSKGLIGLAFPLLILAGDAWLRRRPRLLSLALDPRGWLVFLALTVPWFWAMEQAHPGFLRHHLVNEQFLRFLGQRHPPDIIPFPLPGFWLFLFIWLLPWGLLLPEALYRFWQGTAAPEPARRARLLLLWAAVVMVFFSISSTRIEYYSLPALPALALVVGWRLAAALENPRDRSLPIALLLLGLLGLAVGVLLPYLEQLCAANRREFFGMFPLIQPIARQVSLWVPFLALTGAAVGWRRPALALAGYSLVALALLFYTWQTLTALSPLLSDRLPGDLIRRQAGPGDVVVMEAIEEFEYGASLAYYSGRRVLMVQRRGLPQFPYPVAPEQNYLITPEALRELWKGRHRVFLLIDDVITPDPFLENAPVLMTLPGKRILSNRP